MNSSSTVSCQPGSTREVLKFAWPLIVNLSTSAIMLFFDRIFLSWSSVAAVQAVIPAGVLSWAFLSPFVTLAEYSGVFVAQYYGAKDYRNCSRAAFNGMVIGAFAGILILACIPLGNAILAIFEDNPLVLQEEQTFFTLIMYAYALAPISTVFESFFNSSGRTRVTMVVSVVRDISVIVMDYLLILGHGGFPAMGIRGAGWAAVICYSISVLVFAHLYFSRRYQGTYHTRKEMIFDSKLCQRILRYGTPSAIHATLEVASYTIFTMILGKYSDLEQFAGNVVISLQHLAYIVFLGLGISASILVGQYQGSCEPQIALLATKNAIKVSAIVSGLFALALFLFPSFFLAIFAGHGGVTASIEAVMPIAHPLMMSQAFWTFFSAFECIGAGGLKGAGDTRFVMIYASSLAWGYLVTGLFAIIYIFHGPIIIAWLWCTSWQFLLAVGYMWRFFGGRRWQKIDLLGRNNR